MGVSLRHKPPSIPATSVQFTGNIISRAYMKLRKNFRADILLVLGGKGGHAGGRKKHSLYSTQLTQSTRAMFLKALQGIVGVDRDDCVE